MDVKSAVQMPGEAKSNAARSRVAQYVGRGHKTYTPTQIAVSKAEGVYLWNAEGRKFLDFTAGVLVANLGHNHAGFEAAYAQYAEGLPRSSYNMFMEVDGLAAQRLIASLDAPKMQKLFWADSGSAGIIKAMWCAQHRQPGKKIMLATRGGFHGKKGLAGDVTGTSSPNPNVRFISFPTCDHCDKVPQEHKGQEKYCRGFYDQELADLKAEFPDDIVLLITEPYLGAAGSFHPPSWYLQLLNRWCDDNDVAFIIDEVQACHGRTGAMFAFQKHGLSPDLVVLGKGLGNGEPVAATVGRADLIDALDYGEGSDTYSGNPRACAAVLAVLDIYAEVNVVENCQRAGSAMEAGLRALRDEFPFVAFVRGEGLVFGVEMQDYNDKTAAEIANQCVLECYAQGLHLMGPLASKVLRVSPPLVITEAQVQEGLAMMRKAFAQVA